MKGPWPELSSEPQRIGWVVALGSAINGEIVNAHRDEVSVHKQPGVGAMLTLSLPLDPDGPTTSSTGRVAVLEVSS